MHCISNTTTLTEIAEQPIRMRQFAGRGTLPAETDSSTSDDGATMRIALHGIRGERRSMIVDADLWPSIVCRWGGVWLLNSNGQGRDYVRRSAQAIGANAHQPGECPTATLARLITRAKRGEVVFYRDGNPLNVRRANLEVVPRAQARARQRAPSA